RDFSSQVAARVGEGERFRFLEYRLPGDWYAHWLTGLELSRREAGRHHKGWEALEAVVAAFEAGLPPEPEPESESAPDEPLTDMPPFMAPPTRPQAPPPEEPAAPP